MGKAIEVSSGKKEPAVSLVEREELGKTIKWEWKTITGIGIGALLGAQPLVVRCQSGVEKASENLPHEMPSQAV